jgi:hypothetical protein
MILKIRYKGFGDSIPMIPARDLTDEEVARLRPEEIEWMKASGLYEFIEDKPKPPKKAARPKELNP